MFYCKACQEKNNWGIGLVVSFRKCDVCGFDSACFNVPSIMQPIHPRNLVATLHSDKPAADEPTVIGEPTPRVGTVNTDWLPDEAETWAAKYPVTATTTTGMSNARGESFGGELPAWGTSLLAPDCITSGSRRSLTERATAATTPTDNPTQRSIELAAQLWCKPAHANKAMDVDLGYDIARLIDSEVQSRCGSMTARVGVSEPIQCGRGREITASDIRDIAAQANPVRTEIMAKIMEAAKAGETGVAIAIDAFFEYDRRSLKLSGFICETSSSKQYKVISW